MQIEKNINGLNYFEIQGEINNEIILIFLPGIGVTKENYLYFLTSLKAYYQTIYSLDLPGQGSKGEWTIGNMVENLKEFIHLIDHQKKKVIHLAGHSAGALAIISFIINYDRQVENILLQSKNVSIDDIYLSEKLELSGFAQVNPEIQKVDKVLLFSLPYSFDIVFPRSLSMILKRKSQICIKRLLNTFINWPMLFFGHFQKDNHVKFQLNRNGSPQYFNLELKSSSDFFDYISKYETLFEIYNKLNKKFQTQISTILKSKNVLIQYGSIDWMIKPLFRRKYLALEYSEKDFGFSLVRHRRIGHLLRGKCKLDIDLNRQFITNKEVVAYSVKFIND